MKNISAIITVISVSLTLILINSCSKSNNETPKEKTILNNSKPTTPEVIITDTTAKVINPESISKPSKPSDLVYSGKVIEITSDEHFSKVIKRSNSKLIMFDLYADWCGPCKTLSPMLEKMAPTVSNKVEIYKVNVDKLPNISRSFGVKGIPLVVLIKDEKGVDRLIGLRQEKDYRAMIEKYKF